VSTYTCQTCGLVLTVSPEGPPPIPFHIADVGGGNLQICGRWLVGTEVYEPCAFNEEEGLTITITSNEGVCK
jgi:hypothetical protein